MKKIRIMAGAAIAAAVMVASAALTAEPSFAAVAHVPASATAAKPQNLPQCIYEGLIKSNANKEFLQPVLYGTDADYQGEYLVTRTAATGETFCVQAASQGGYYILPVSAGGSLCLDGGPQTLGIRPWLWGCNGTITQRWCWNGNGYIVRPNVSLSIKENGTNQYVTLAGSGSNTWSALGPVPNSC